MKFLKIGLLVTVLAGMSSCSMMHKSDHHGESKCKDAKQCKVKKKKCGTCEKKSEACKTKKTKCHKETKA